MRSRPEIVITNSICMNTTEPSQCARTRPSCVCRRPYLRSGSRSNSSSNLRLEPPSRASGTGIGNGPSSQLQLSLTPAHARSPADLSADLSAVLTALAPLLSLITRLRPSSPSLTRWVDLRSSSCTEAGRVEGSTLTHDRLRALRISVAGRARGEVGGVYLPGEDFS